MSQEMQEFREMQADQKTVFLSNLEGMERSLKEKDQEISEVSKRYGFTLFVNTYRRPGGEGGGGGAGGEPTWVGDGCLDRFDG